MNKKKNTLLAVLILSAFLCNAQSATFSEVSSKKVKGDLDSYTTNSGEEFKVGNTIIVGTSFRGEEFSYIKQDAGFTVYPLTNTASGSEVSIKKMKSKSGRLFVYTTKPSGHAYGLLILNFEEALKNEEIKSTRMSSDDALSALKKWKDKLDLGLITPEEYEAKKKELVEFID